MIRRLAFALFALLLAAPVAASTYAEVEKTCAVGAEKFKFLSVVSISSYYALPDGMPVGSGDFPIAVPQCPGNGLVMYEDFDAAKLEQLGAIVSGAEYQALRKTESSFYLAHWLALRLGEPEAAPGWLLRASWDAKNRADDARARRYNEAFVALVGAAAPDATDFASIAMRGRAANALRELGRFDEAEALRRSIAIDLAAGGTGDDAKRGRAGLAEYLASLAPPIARRDGSRAPLDMLGERTAAMLCIDRAPLSEFERAYCARPAVAAESKRIRKVREDYR